jgi:hypothetical protein
MDVTEGSLIPYRELSNEVNQNFRESKSLLPIKTSHKILKIDVTDAIIFIL